MPTVRHGCPVPWPARDWGRTDVDNRLCFLVTSSEGWIDQPVVRIVEVANSFIAEAWVCVGWKRFARTYALPAVGRTIQGLIDD
jgi:hypothetical protein